MGPGQQAKDIYLSLIIFLVFRILYLVLVIIYYTSPHPMGAAIYRLRTEVNISPKISISAQPLKMALHRNPAVHGTRMVIFLHDSKKAPF